MRITYRINEKYRYMERALLGIPPSFERLGEVLKKGRNEIRVIEVEGIPLNVKSYKRPNPLNRLVYAYLRASKAQRSYDHAFRLAGAGIGTPEPVAYIVYRERLGVTRSFYISRHVAFDREFRDLKGSRPPDMEELLKAFTRFTHDLHRHHIYFLDHSPGNTLITKKGEDYRFHLVDLNRMKFTRVSPRKGLRNFRRLNADEEMIQVIATEYARLTNSDPGKMTRLLARWTARHDERVRKRRARKEKTRRRQEGR
ncbi:MAG: hypothetical protein LBP56_04295 [Odoribacteraceae bacterium]|jgi:hypothetical protein|nr:hypothetical protein [Odoribacteraceae bacterium]